MEPKPPSPMPSILPPADDSPHPVAKLPIHPPVLPEEFGGSGKPEPTRYGDWEVNGRCTDF